MMRNNSETEPLTIYQERNAQVEKTCQKYGLYSSEYETNQFQISKNSYKPPQQVNMNSPFSIENNIIIITQNSLMYLPSHGLLYCWIHKAASTSWNKIFFNISHIGVGEADLHTAAQRFRPDTEKVKDLFQNSFSFLFVRHPFERIVSAFRDKFETGKKTNWMYRMYAGDILGLTGDQGIPKDDAYLASVYRKIKNQPRPTFAQFISYLLRTPIHDYNDHWSPFWLHCHLCSPTSRSNISSNISARDPQKFQYIK